MQEILLGEYIKSNRKKLGITQEELCAGICDVSTLSRLERNKQTPSRDTVKALLHRLGLPTDKFFALVSEHDQEIGALKREIQANLIEFEKVDQSARPMIRERTLAELAALEALAEEDDVINRQYSLSAQVTLGKPEGPYPHSQQKTLLLRAIRLTIPNFRLDRVERSRYRMEEINLLNKLARTLSMEGKRNEAIDLYSRLLQNLEKNNWAMEEYAAQFCLIAHNCAIALGRAGRYEEAVSLAKRGQETGIKYGDFTFLPGFLAIQAECWFFLNEREKSAGLYTRAAYLYDIIGDIHNLVILREEMQEHLGIESPV